MDANLPLHAVSERLLYSVNTMRRSRTILIPAVLAALALVGCGTNMNPRVGPSNRLFGDGDGLRLREPNSDAQSTTDRRAALALADIEPRPTVPTTRLTTYKPSPPKALVLYAQGRAALADGARFTAIKKLEQAIAIDPLSPASYVLLAQAQLGDGVFHDKSIAALETAIELEPTDITTRTEIGRQYLAKGDVPRALNHLRLAITLLAYDAHLDDAALADLYLAKTLEKGGYDRAAVEQYELLLAKLKTRELSLRRDVELAVLVANPDLISLEIAKLYDRQKQYDRALAILEPVAAAAPNNFGVQANVVRLMAQVGRSAEAIDRATQLVKQFRASRPSVDLLRDVCRDGGKHNDAITRLRLLVKQNPADRTMLFALADVLTAEGRDTEATQLLVDALGKTSADVEITRRLFAVYDSRNEVTKAARLLITTVTRQPELASELSPLWDRLINPLRPGRLRVDQLATEKFPTLEQPAAIYFQTRAPETARTSLIVRQKLTQAISDTKTAFTPAYRALFDAIWSSTNSESPARKVQESEKLAKSAETTGDTALALELRGRTAIKQGDAKRAVTLLESSIKKSTGTASADRLLITAAALEAVGQGDRARQKLWKLVSDRPTLEAGYRALFDSYLSANDTTAAVKVVTSWLSTDPTSTGARLLQAGVLRQSGHTEAADRVIVELLDEQPADSSVLTEAFILYTSTGREDEFLTKLEAIRARDPQNLAAGQMLVELYTGRRNADAARVLDSLRDAAINATPSLTTDADALYAFAGYYTHVGLEESAEKLLEQAVERDPGHAGASNDLGYAWADAGKNLERAEAMIRLAVAAEPRNASFLDSLGWVLYKRGQYEEAVRHLELAASVTDQPDPIVLDHLGDTTYRLDRATDAVDHWRQSLDRVNESDPSRRDLQDLKLRLLQKIKQIEAGQSVNVAPVAQSGAKENPQARGRN